MSFQRFRIIPSQPSSPKYTEEKSILHGKAREWKAGNFELQGQPWQDSFSSEPEKNFEQALDQFVQSIPKANQTKVRNWILQSTGIGQEIPDRTNGHLLNSLLSLNMNAKMGGNSVHQVRFCNTTNRIIYTAKIPAILETVEKPAAPGDTNYNFDNFEVTIEASVDLNGMDEQVKAECRVKPADPLFKEMLTHIAELPFETTQVVSFDIDNTFSGTGDHAGPNLTPELLTIAYFCEAAQIPYVFATNRSLHMDITNLFPQKDEQPPKPNDLKQYIAESTLSRFGKMLTDHGLKTDIYTPLDKTRESQYWQTTIAKSEEDFLTRIPEGNDKDHKYWEGEFKSAFKTLLDEEDKIHQEIYEAKNLPKQRQLTVAVDKVRNESKLHPDDYVQVLHVDDDANVCRQLPKLELKSTQITTLHVTNPYNFDAVLIKMASFIGLDRFAKDLLLTKKFQSPEKVLQDLSAVRYLLHTDPSAEIFSLAETFKKIHFANLNKAQKEEFEFLFFAKKLLVNCEFDAEHIENNLAAFGYLHSAQPTSIQFCVSLMRFREQYEDKLTDQHKAHLDQIAKEAAKKFDFVSFYKNKYATCDSATKTDLNKFVYNYLEDKTPQLKRSKCLYIAAKDVSRWTKFKNQWRSMPLWKKVVAGVCIGVGCLLTLSGLLAKVGLPILGVGLGLVGATPLAAGAVTGTIGIAHTIDIATRKKFKGELDDLVSSKEHHAISLKYQQKPYQLKQLAAKIEAEAKEVKTGEEKTPGSNVSVLQTLSQTHPKLASQINATIVPGKKDHVTLFQPFAETLRRQIKAKKLAESAEQKQAAQPAEQQPSNNPTP